MRIAVIGTKGLPPGQGGIEHHSAELYPRMVRLGHTVDVFARAPYIGARAFQRSSFQGIDVMALPCLGWRGADAITASLLGSLLSVGRYDVIHFHGLGPALFSWMPRLASRTKVIVTCQGLDWQRAKWGRMSSGIIRTGERVAVRCAHAIIVVSEALKRYFAATYGRDTVVIPNGPAAYAASDPRVGQRNALGLETGRYALFLGRIVPEKRPDMALDAFVATQRADWKIAFVGSSSDTDLYARDLRRRAAGREDVVFTGERHGAELADLVRGAGLLILPSDVEGLPLVVLEAMAEGLPVVASDIPPHRQLLERHRGALFKAGDLASCAATLGWAMANGAQMRRMARVARDHVRSHYDWDRITDRTLQIYGA